MLGALFSFLGGSAFRLVWGEISAFITKAQDHKYEIERMRLEGELDAAKHSRDIESIRIQAELQVKQIEISTVGAVSKEEAVAFTEAVKAAWAKTGIPWVDAWNGAIKPAAVSFALLLWASKVIGQGFFMDPYDMDLTAGLIGFVIADRRLALRGK